MNVFDLEWCLVIQLPRCRRSIKCLELLKGEILLDLPAVSTSTVMLFREWFAVTASTVMYFRESFAISARTIMCNWVWIMIRRNG